MVSENSHAWSLWEWLKDVAPGNLAHMNVLDISWFTDSMRERRPVAVETRHLIEVGGTSCVTAVFGWLGGGSALGGARNQIRSSKGVPRALP